MDEKGGYDILCPFGGGKVILVNGKVDSAERDQTDEEADVPDEPESQATSVPLDAMDMEPDLDDFAGTAEISTAQAVQPQNSKYEPWISVKTSDKDSRPKKIHKSSILPSIPVH